MKYKAAEFQTSGGIKVSADHVMNGFSFVEENPIGFCPGGELGATKMKRLLSK
jgi:hypothetical protein